MAPFPHHKAALSHGQHKLCYGSRKDNERLQLVVPIIAGVVELEFEVEQHLRQYQTHFRIGQAVQC